LGTGSQWKVRKRRKRLRTLLKAAMIETWLNWQNPCSGSDHRYQNAHLIEDNLYFSRETV
jgi:hypothetical protein